MDGAPFFEALPPDCRGEIVKVAWRGERFNLLYSRAGSLRAGDVHPVDQYGAVLSGVVQIETPFKVTFYYRGQFIHIPAGVPHLYTYIEDTVQLEWWNGPFEAHYYPPYRTQVEAWMAQAQGKGKPDEKR